ncbi:MAG: hypothetical protein IKJ13_03560 [Clostridia bacterium]|nr:hypothetical protein [Clostridia bacterium]
MIYTFLADISRLDLDAALNLQKEKITAYGHFEKKIKKIPCGKFNAPKMGDEIVSHILSGEDITLRRERCGAYLLLSSVMVEMFGGMIAINREPNGRPFFDKSSEVRFSISHSSNAVAVSISTEGPVGVDIEGEISPQRAERLEKRFFSELTINDRNIDVTYIYCILGRDGECNFYPFNEEKEHLMAKTDLGVVALDKTDLNCCFSAKWTLYEATMKCGGGGFTSLPCLGMLLLETKANTKKICINGVVYYITTATAV